MTIIERPITSNSAIPKKLEPLAFRRVKPSDAGALLDMTGDFEAVIGANFPVFGTYEYWSRRINQTGAHNEMLLACQRTQVIGWSELVIDLNNPLRRHVGQLGLCVHRDFRSRGVGRELLAQMLQYAQRWQQLRRVELIVWKDNVNARHLYESSGFVIEGEMAAYALRDGRYDSALLMARLFEPPQITRT